MAPSAWNLEVQSGVERVRHRLLTALHFGRLSPGDRVPSVRRLADLTGLNRKTVHRAYRRLAHEGLLDLRPGSGTFVADRRANGAERPLLADLMVAANRCRAAAADLGLAADTFGAFLRMYLASSVPDVSLAVTECNLEQLGLIDDELRLTLGVRTKPMLLAELASAPAESLRGQWGVVTTDCHRNEVARLFEGRDVPVYRVALDPSFPQRLVEQARDARVVLVVRDARFAAAFLRLLRQMSVDEERIARFDVVEPAEARSLLRSLAGPAAVYVSPFVDPPSEASARGQLRLARLRWRLEPGSVDRLRAALALDLASRDRPLADPG